MSDETKDLHKVLRPDPFAGVDPLGIGAVTLELGRIATVLERAAGVQEELAAPDDASGRRHLLRSPPCPGCGCLVRVEGGEVFGSGKTDGCPGCGAERPPSLGWGDLVDLGLAAFERQDHDRDRVLAEVVSRRSTTEPTTPEGAALVATVIREGVVVPPAPQSPAPASTRPDDGRPLEAKVEPANTCVIRIEPFVYTEDAARASSEPPDNYPMAIAVEVAIAAWDALQCEASCLPLRLSPIVDKLRRWTRLPGWQDRLRAQAARLHQIGRPPVEPTGPWEHRREPMSAHELAECRASLEGAGAAGGPSTEGHRRTLAMARRMVDEIDRLRDAHEKPRWISVAERLPPDGLVLAWHVGEEPWRAGSGSPTGSYVAGVGSGGWYECGGDELANVTHWQPLPLPPAEGGPAEPNGTERQLAVDLALAVDQLVRQCDIEESEDLAWLEEAHPGWRSMLPAEGGDDV